MGASHGHCVGCRDKCLLVHYMVSVLWISWWRYDLCWKKASGHDALDYVVADADFACRIPVVLISKVMSERDVSPSAPSMERRLV